MVPEPGQNLDVYVQFVGSWLCDRIHFSAAWKCGKNILSKQETLDCQETFDSRKLTLDWIFSIQDVDTWLYSLLYWLDII